MVFGEAEAELIEDRIGDSVLVASHLLDFEIASIAVKKWRNKDMSAAQLRAALLARAEIAVRLLAVDFEAAFDLATMTKLSAYDASYLWLARRYDAELVTLDKRLDAAFISGAGR